MYNNSSFWTAISNAIRGHLDITQNVEKYISQKCVGYVQTPRGLASVFCDHAKLNDGSTRYFYSKWLSPHQDKDGFLTPYEHLGDSWTCPKLDIVNEEM